MATSLRGLLLLTILLNVVEASAGQLTLSWVDNSGGNAAFSIERRVGSNTTFAVLAAVMPGVSSYVDATVVPAMSYCYRVRAYNEAGASGYSNEACGSASPLTATLTNPRDGATVSGTATVSVTASGGTAPYTYRVQADGATVYTGSTGTFGWNTTTVANGTRQLNAIVTDSGEARETTTASLTVTVSNPPPTAAPDFSVQFLYPAEGATVWGQQQWVLITTTPASNEAKTLTLSLNGEVVRTATITSWLDLHVWNTTTIPNGRYTLALDVTYNGVTASATRTVLVANFGDY